MTQFIDTLVGIFQSSGFAKFGEPGGYLYAVMICVGCFLLYLAIVKEFEPLILLPMAFGMILANLPGSGVIHMQYFVGDGLEHPMWVEILNNGGLADMLYMGVKLGIYPPLIFLGIGTMTDFAPLISNPKSLLLGAAAQFGIFGTYMGARLLAATGLVDFTQKQSAAIYDNIMYAELNTKSDYCQCCGYDGEIKIVEDDGKLVWECPKCGNRDQNKLNVARRTCGYIGTQFWNQGRTQEIKDRVLHL